MSFGPNNENFILSLDVKVANVGHSPAESIEISSVAVPSNLVVPGMDPQRFCWSAHAKHGEYEMRAAGANPVIDNPGKWGSCLSTVATTGCGFEVESESVKADIEWVA